MERLQKVKNNLDKKRFLFRLFFSLSLSLCCGLFWGCALGSSLAGLSLGPALFGLLLASLVLFSNRCANIKGKVFGGAVLLPAPISMPLW